MTSHDNRVDSEILIKYSVKFNELNIISFPY